jgi:hypothetical protein
MKWCTYTLSLFAYTQCMYGTQSGLQNANIVLGLCPSNHPGTKTRDFINIPNI